MCVGIGYTVGPLLGGYMSSPNPDTGDVSFLPAAMLTSALYCAISLFVWFAVEETNPPARRDKRATKDTKGSGKSKWWDLACSTPILLRLLVLRAFLDFAYFTYKDSFSLLLHDQYHMTPREISWTMSFIGVLTVVSQGYVIQFATRRWSNFSLLRWSILTLAFLYVASAGSPLCSKWYIIVWLIPFDVAGSVAKTVSTALITEQVDSHKVGSVLGLTSSISSVGRVLCPSLGGWLFSHSHELPAVLAAVVTGLLFVALELNRSYFVATAHESKKEKNKDL